MNLEDREKVRELFARYAAVDSIDRHEEWLGLYTDDAHVRSTAGGEFDGKEALRMVTSFMAQLLSDGVQSRHVIDNLVMDLDEVSGTASCTLTTFHTTGGVTKLYIVAAMTAKLKKVGGNWYIEDLDQVIDTDIGAVDIEGSSRGPATAA